MPLSRGPTKRSPFRTVASESRDEPRRPGGEAHTTTTRSAYARLGMKDNTRGDGALVKAIVIVLGILAILGWLGSKYPGV